jgi:hypothetical protein
MCHLLDEGDGDPGISLRRAWETPVAWLAENYYIRFNTVVVRTAGRYGIEVESSEFKTKHIEVYGNVLINTEDISKALAPQYIDYLSSNYTSTSLQGFVNTVQSPYDFQLTADSPVRYYASTEPQFPKTDTNGITPDARSEDQAKSGPEGQARAPDETSNRSPENSDVSLAKDQASPSADRSDKLFRISGLKNYAIVFLVALLIGLLMIGAKMRRS